MNRNNSHYMHRPNPAEGDGKERHDYEMLQALRGKGLRLTSPREDWVRECGVDWTVFFFQQGRECSGEWRDRIWERAQV